MPRGKGELKKQDLEKYYISACTLIDVFDREYKHIYKKATLQNKGIEADSQKLAAHAGIIKLIDYHHKEVRKVARFEFINKFIHPRACKQLF